MKKKILLIFFAGFCVLTAQNKMYIHRSDNVVLGVPLSAINKILFRSNKDSLFVSSGTTNSNYSVGQIDSISFNSDSDTIRINYNGNSVSIVNPLAFENVSVKATNANVIVTSTSSVKNLNYKVSGTTSNGMLKIYSSSQFNLVLNNLNLTNLTGPAINIQSGSSNSVIVTNGTTNTISDGATYSDTYLNESGVTEDQNAAFFSKGTLTFSGTGNLTINGNGASKHALYSKDYINFRNASLTIKSAAKDGIHPKDGFKMESGYISINSTGDGIDADNGYVNIIGGTLITNSSTASSDGIKSLTTMNISNAEVNVTVAGDQSKGLKAGYNMELGAGNITVNASGGVVLEASGTGYDPSYCTAIKSDSTITINGATITIKSSGKSGKGISSDRDIVINDGNINITSSGAGALYTNSSGITDTYHSTCITADANIIINGGTITTSSSGAGGRGITSDGTLTVGTSTISPNINITTTGSKIYISGSGDSAEYDEAKAIKCDGIITINNGNLSINSADDGIKSDVSITVNNGTINISKSIEGMEAPYITYNNGTVNITSSDDCINTTKGNGGESNDGSFMYLHGGNITLNTTGGDGLDSNGSIEMTAGTVIVNGPPSSPEVGMDYNGTFNISGGFLIVSGPNSGNMIQATSTTSAQYSIKATTSSAISTSSLFCLQDASGNNLVTFKPIRNCYYFIFSSPDLKSGSTYNIYTGGTSTGTLSNGIYLGGSYSGGTLKKSFSLTSKVTSVTF